LPFTSIRLGGGLAPPSCQTCSAHKKKPPVDRCRPEVRFQSVMWSAGGDKTKPSLGYPT
jgi:hypothetical protein